jgi:DNA-binding NarL/FixJ family response regulator
MLADDHPDMLRQIAHLLRTDFDIVGVVGDGVALVTEGSRVKPDVVVTDLRMPGINGIQAGHDLLQANACKAVVILSMYNDPMLAQTAFEAGIRGYVLKMTAGEDLIPAIHQIVAGGTYFSPALLTGVFQSSEVEFRLS